MSEDAERLVRHDPPGHEVGPEAFRSSPEFDGYVESLDDARSGGHFALIYETPEERAAALAPFVEQGLERDERCMCVVDEASKAEAIETLRDSGVDVDAALDSGSLTFHSVEETYLVDGTFDADETLAFYADAIEAATAEYEALRVTAETRWLTGEGTDVEEFMRYESRVNELFREEDCIALCQYDRARISDEILCDVIRTHPQLVYDNTVCHNFYYTPPDEFLGRERSDREVDQRLGTLLDRAEARIELREHRDWLQRQNEITADPNRSFEGKLQALFELGCDRFDLELGAMARVDPENDRFEIEYTSGDHDHFEPGFELPLSETYCTAVVDSEGAVGVADPFDGGYDDITVHAEFGVKAYLGTYVEIDGDLDRTFFFVTSQPWEGEFSEQELTFHRQMGLWVKSETERKLRERYQRTLYEITADADRTFHEKLEALFELGCDRFDLELGGLARIDPGDDLFEVEVVSGDHEHLEPGARADLSETYCRAVVDGEAPTGITDPEGSGFGDTVAYREFGVNAYLGTRIALDGDSDRSLFFVSSEPRERGFSGAERTFHRLMGQWVKGELERRQRERALEKSNERLEQFAYAASHDLQEPLRMVTSYLRLIEKRYGDALDDDGEELFEFAVDGADRMREMIDGLLKYSRVQTGGDPLEPVDLDDVLEEAIEDLRVRIEESGAEISAATLPRVRGDETQLRQLFENLLSNAIEYSEDDPPRVAVSVERSESDWIVSVRDEGIGIDPEDTDRIFDVFQRLHGREEHSGTGVGLALCNRIVERHGGRLWVDSEPGEGSTFSFTLPAAGEQMQ